MIILWWKTVFVLKNEHTQQKNYILLSGGQNL